jgi:hypothetical protein
VRALVHRLKLLQMQCLFSFFLSLSISPLIWKICLFALFNHWASLSLSLRSFLLFSCLSLFYPPLSSLSVLHLTHIMAPPYVRIIRI